MSAVLVTDYFAVSGRDWDLSSAARSRWRMLVPWAAGFVTYQLINPGYVSWWASGWTSVGRAIGFRPATWMSASILSFGVAAVITLLTGPTRGAAPGARRTRPAAARAARAGRAARPDRRASRPADR